MVAEAAGSRRRIAVSAVLGARAESTAATLGALDGASEAMPAARASVDARPFVYYIVSSRMRRRSVKQATCGWTASERNSAASWRLCSRGAVLGATQLSRDTNDALCGRWLIFKHRRHTQ